VAKTFASVCVAFVLMVVICAAVSAAFYTFIERPMLQRLMSRKRVAQADAFARR
jgi:peptidoglycan/LPS O-acetylase OafA/YrhL